MGFKLKYTIGALLLLLSLNSFASKSHIKNTISAKAKDPVSWQLNRTFQNPVYVGRTYSVTYTFTSQLPFTMRKPLVIQKNATSANEFSYVDACSGKKLVPQQTCTVKATFVPTTSGNKSLQLIITGYDDNRVLVPTLMTQAKSSSVTTSQVYGNVSQSLPGSMQTAQTGNYIFTFTNPTTTDATGFTVNVSQSQGTASYTTTCTSTLAKNGGSCTVTGTYTPSSTNPSIQSVTATANYGQGQSTSITTSTVVSTSSTTGVVGAIVGNYYLPAVMVGGSTQYTLWFIFTNNGPGSTTVTTTGTPVVATIGGSSVTLTSQFNHCLNTPLAVGAQCDIQYTLQAATVVSDTPVTVAASVDYTGSPGGTASVLTSTTIVPSLSTSRTLTFVNNCNFPVWFSINGGQLGSTACNTDADCPTGTACSSINNRCFWKNYAPNGPGGGGGSSLYELDMAGGLVTTNTVTIPLTSADPAIQWSGNISASLGCGGSSGACTQAECGNNNGSTACQQGQGFTPPATQAEITMNISSADSYDVEVINGFHIPISMAPTAYVTANNYNCGAPGNFASANNFGSCNWGTASPPGNGYYWVTSGGSACNISSPSCSAGQVCGLDSNLNQRCGNFLGYWTGDQVCSMPNISATVSSYFQCSTPLAGLSNTVTFPSGGTLYDLMACAVPKGDVEPTYNSCYLTYSSVPANNQLSCCGCIDWWTVSGISSNSNTQSCTQSGQSTPQTDPVWNTYIQNTVAWMKKACPSAYTYPFDDKTSGFSCTDTLPGSPNSTSYTITFCQGNTGLPSGVSEGRG